MASSSLRSLGPCTRKRPPTRSAGLNMGRLGRVMRPVGRMGNCAATMTKSLPWRTAVEERKPLGIAHGSLLRGDHDDGLRSVRAAGLVGHPDAFVMEKTALHGDPEVAVLHIGKPAERPNKALGCGCGGSLPRRLRRPSRPDAGSFDASADPIDSSWGRPFPWL